MKKPIIKKLNDIFKMGYIPSRGFETYEYVLPKSGVSTSELGNCFVHACFNLKNEHFENFNITRADFFELRNFSFWDMTTKELTSYFLKLISSTGLKVKICNAETIVNKNQWKVAFYLDKGISPDYHFLLQEKDGSWSGKVG